MDRKSEYRSISKQIPQLFSLPVTLTQMLFTSPPVSYLLDIPIMWQKEVALD
jgi:hypothetical protein